MNMYHRTKNNGQVQTSSNGNTIDSNLLNTGISSEILQMITITKILLKINNKDITKNQ